MLQTSWQLLLDLKNSNPPLPPSLSHLFLLSLSLMKIRLLYLRKATIATYPSAVSQQTFNERHFPYHTHTINLCIIYLNNHFLFQLRASS